ncbi:hypothetical protein QJS66_13825 [Kocuria rhizophila]|nr:hypothetical protein QJS66_13825 [Kocuria rhizophila]
MPGRNGPVYSERLAFSARSVMLDGEQCYLDSHLLTSARSCTRSTTSPSWRLKEQAYLPPALPPGRFSGGGHPQLVRHGVPAHRDLRRGHPPSASRSHPGGPGHGRRGDEPGRPRDGPARTTPRGRLAQASALPPRDRGFQGWKCTDV